jgi:hypothetical protein
MQGAPREEVLHDPFKVLARQQVGIVRAYQGANGADGRAAIPLDLAPEREIVRQHSQPEPAV